MNKIKETTAPITVETSNNIIIVYNMATRWIDRMIIERAMTG